MKKETASQQQAHRKTDRVLSHRVYLVCSRFIFPILLCTQAAFAHEVRPAYLKLHQTSADSFDVFWKVPGAGENLRLALYVEFPTGCTNVTPVRGSFINSAFIERWTVKRAGGLVGGLVQISGLRATVTEVLVRLENMDGTSQLERLTPSHPSFVVAASPRRLEVARAYLGLGVEHILLGIDHLLFVLALIIITKGGWKLVKTVSAFTVSHSITLTAATLGFVHVPQKPVEAVIALSIVFVAAEILHGRQGRPGLTARWPWIVALTFGLLHGLGFAGALSEVGLPQGHIPLALLFFSVGVEIGQLLFIATVLSVFALGTCAAKWLRSSMQLRRKRLFELQRTAAVLPLLPPYAIGAVAIFWVIQRIAAF